MASVLFRAFLIVLITDSLLLAFPLNPDYENNTQTYIEYFNTTNGTAHDLYIIRTIIYEVGILTDADNDTDSSNETHEEVDLTFYDPGHNGSAIDLSHIPVPVQTNISGEIITGIASANFGVLSLPSSGNKREASYLPLKAPIIPNVLITQTSNISTTDPEQEKKIIEGLPEEVGI